jgi:pimeloyl-ACP methyl ester carboxylesterase
MLLQIIPLMMGLATAATPVSLTATDGSTIYAVSNVAHKSSKGVLLAHMLGRDSSDWESLTKRLSAVNLTTLAIDLRGHGKSSKAGTTLGEDDYKNMVQDLEAGAAWLRSKGITDITCIGASIGANLCARLGAKDLEIVNLVLLSPGLNHKGVTSGDAIQAYGDRPVLLVAAEDDRFGPRSASILEDVAKGQVHYELLNEGGHGTKMLTRDAKLEGVVLSWVLGTFKLMSGELVRPKPNIQLENDTITTSGKKLQVHQ